MITRTICLLALVLAVPARAAAAGYVVHPGDSLAIIAQRYHVSVWSLARANGIRNTNLIRVGQLLRIPGGYQGSGQRVLYHVRWGDTLSSVALRYGTTVHTLRVLNPSIGRYLLAGQWIVVRGGVAGATTSYAGTGARHVVQVGETLSAIAAAHGISISSLMSANNITNPDHIEIGAVLVIPGAAPSYGSSSYGGSAVYDPYTARALIEQDAAYFGIEPALPLAVAWEESGFNQTLTSETGAVGVMQVEPFTARHISRLLGRPINIWSVTDNVYAGVYWLYVLLRYYGGDERLAVAAYYQGVKALARVGMYADTKQYVANVMALKLRVGG